MDINEKTTRRCDFVFNEDKTKVKMIWSETGRFLAMIPTTKFYTEKAGNVIAPLERNWGADETIL